MQIVTNIYSILLLCLLLLASYILIMDDKQIIINPTINNLCKNNVSCFIFSVGLLHSYIVVTSRGV